jgi:hypothetical protein
LTETYPVTVTGYYTLPDPKNEYVVTGKVNIYKKEKQLILENAMPGSWIKIPLIYVLSTK